MITIEKATKEMVQLENCTLSTCVRYAVLA